MAHRKEYDRLLKHLRGVQYIVINTEHGGFGLSHAAIKRYHEINNQKIWIEPNKKYNSVNTVWLVPEDERVPIADTENWHTLSDQEKLDYNNLYESQTWHERHLTRDDPTLVQVVRELGSAANGRFAKLKIVEIPAGVDWQIDEYDGAEWVAEKHRTWR